MNHLDLLVINTQQSSNVLSFIGSLKNAKSFRQLLVLNINHHTAPRSAFSQLVSVPTLCQYLSSHSMYYYTHCTNFCLFTTCILLTLYSLFPLQCHQSCVL